LPIIGVDPEKVLIKKAFAGAHLDYVLPEEFEDRQIRVLSSALKDKFKKILAEVSPSEP